MLTIVRSPLTTFPLGASDRDTVLAPALAFFKRVRSMPHRVVWVVPNALAHRLKTLHSEWPRQVADAAGLVPTVQTFEQFVFRTLCFRSRPVTLLSAGERWVRLARVWHDITGRSAGSTLVKQLDHFVCDWQAGSLDPPLLEGFSVAAVLQRYLGDCAADKVLDPAEAVKRLTEELLDRKTATARLALTRTDLVVFDGFHRLERSEIDLIAELARRRDVLLWLTGVRGQFAWSTLELCVHRFQERVEGVEVLDHDVDVGPIAGVGRRLFCSRSGALVPDRIKSVPGLLELETPTVSAEITAIATRIKHDVSTSRSSGLDFHDITVVVPGPTYEAVLRETFSRLSVPFVWLGTPSSLTDSRPAGLVHAAFAVVGGEWRADLVLDFLQQPLVLRQLVNPNRVFELFESRPQARVRLSYGTLLAGWRARLGRGQADLQAWQSGRQPLPRHRGTLADFLARHEEQLTGLADLIASIERVLRPVAQLEALRSAPPRLATPLRDLVEVCLELFAVVRMDTWLSPGAGKAEAVPVIEFARDQSAYRALVQLLERLARLPRARVPLTRNRQPDALAALQLALAAETYQSVVVDGTGVRVVEAGHWAGPAFRHIYVLGLVEGQVPALPESDRFIARRREVPALAEQLWQREVEQYDLFRRLFESASERLVLSCPLGAAERRARRSPFLVEVEKRVQLTHLEIPSVITCTRQAARELGRAVVRGQTATDLWPDVAATDLHQLGPLVAALTARPYRANWSPVVRINAPALLALAFPVEQAFSPSQLETYAACPFRYFVSSVLRLQEREPEQTRIHYGLLVHRVLQRFYEDGRRILTTPDQPLPATGPKDRARLVELFEHEWHALDDGTLPPNLLDLFRIDAGVLDLYLELIVRIESGSGNFGNLLVEHPLENVDLGADGAGRGVRLNGLIDRVDVQRTNVRRAIVVDYKTGSAPTFAEHQAKVKDGRMIQLPLYAAALQRQHPHLEPVGGVYLHLSEKRGKPSTTTFKFALNPTGDLLAELGSKRVPFNPDGALTLALELVTTLRDGNFSLSLHGTASVHPECTAFCPARHACRHPEGYQTRGGF